MTVIKFHLLLTSGAESGRCAQEAAVVWQHFISFRAGNTKQTQLPVPSRAAVCIC